MISEEEPVYEIAGNTYIGSEIATFMNYWIGFSRSDNRERLKRMRWVVLQGWQLKPNEIQEIEAEYQFIYHNPKH